MIHYHRSMRAALQLDSHGVEAEFRALAMA
jgi:hypothetical protein